MERNEDGELIGIWCDYYQDSVTPDEPIPIPENIYSKITYSGTKPEIKINGGYKKLTVTFYKDDEQVAFQHGDWKFNIDNQDVSDLIEVITSDLEENQIKIKFHGDDSYIGKMLVISYESYTGVKSEVKMNLLGT